MKIQYAFLADSRKNSTSAQIINGYRTICSGYGSKYIRYIHHLVFTTTLQRIYFSYLNLTDEETGGEHLRNFSKSYRKKWLCWDLNTKVLVHRPYTQPLCHPASPQTIFVLLLPVETISVECLEEPFQF